MTDHHSPIIIDQTAEWWQPSDHLPTRDEIQW
jgi:hypothetical protein